jgi:hypothetical protein
MDHPTATQHPPRRDFDGLPGWEIISQGLLDIGDGRASIEAALVASAASRLRQLGVDVPAGSIIASEVDLYDRVEGDVGEHRAHARYNALRRRLVSFLHAASSASTR